MGGAVHTHISSERSVPYRNFESSIVRKERESIAIIVITISMRQVLICNYISQMHAHNKVGKTVRQHVHSNLWPLNIYSATKFNEFGNIESWKEK